MIGLIYWLFLSHRWWAVKKKCRVHGGFKGEPIVAAVGGGAYTISLAEAKGCCVMKKT
ncbi:MAG: hypothetical protein AABY63_00385 [candidate division NC10 bacterium]